MLLKWVNLRWKKSASLAIDIPIPKTTLCHQLQGVASHSEKAFNCQKLLNIEESTLSSQILDIDKCGLPLTTVIINYLLYRKINKIKRVIIDFYKKYPKNILIPGK